MDPLCSQTWHLPLIPNIGGHRQQKKKFDFGTDFLSFQFNTSSSLGNRHKWENCPKDLLYNHCIDPVQDQKDQATNHTLEAFALNNLLNAQPVWKRSSVLLVVKSVEALPSLPQLQRFQTENLRPRETIQANEMLKSGSSANRPRRCLSPLLKTHIYKYDPLHF